MLSSGGVEVRLCKAAEIADWLDYLRDVDCVLHLLGVAHRPSAPDEEYWRINVDVTARLAEAAVKVGVSRFIYLSSVAVHGRNSRMPLREDSAIQPGDINGNTKAAAEQRLRDITRDTDTSWTIIRPPLIYGPGAPGNFRRLAGLLQLGLPLPLLAARAHRSYLALDNLVSALLRVAERPAAANRIYLISDNDDLATVDLVRLMARSQGRPARLWWLPVPVLRLIAACLGKTGDARRLLDDLQIDSSAIRRDLEWEPPLSAETAIYRTLVSLH